MTDREERVARNEAAVREINEDLEDAQSGDQRSPFLRVVCECGDAACEEGLAILTAEYEEVRSDPLRFVVRAGHVHPDIEDVVSETDRFVVVAKREGVAAEIAAEEDPRS